MMDMVDVTHVGDKVRTMRPGEPMSGKGKELCDLLRRELKIPEGVRWFEVRFAFDEVVTVKCEYMPHIEEA